MHLSRRGLLYGSAGVAAVSLAGCSAGEEATQLSGFTGIAMPNEKERWVIESEALEKLLLDSGYEVLREQAGDDAAVQVEQIAAMVNAGVEFLVIAAVENTSLGAVLADAKDNGVTIISYDRLILDTPDVDYYASFDNYQVGVLQAKHIINRLDLDNTDEQFNIELFSGDPGDSNSQHFFLGGLDTLERYIYEGRLNILSGQTEQQDTAVALWDTANAAARMTMLLEGFYKDEKVHALLSPYDGISRGIVEALVDADYKPGSADFPIITGQDAEAPSVKAIKDGTGQTETVFKDTRKLAEVAAGMVESIVDGGSPEVNDLGSYNNGFKFVPAFLLEPVNVDASNWEKVIVGSDYLTMEQIEAGEA